MPRTPKNYSNPTILFRFEDGTTAGIAWEKMAAKELTQELALALVDARLIKPNKLAQAVDVMEAKARENFARHNEHVKLALLRADESRLQAAGIREHNQKSAPNTKKAMILSHPFDQPASQVAAVVKCSAAHVREVRRQSKNAST